LAGFVLIAGFSQLYVGRSDTYSISEFFVMRKWRKLGVGRSAACLLFERFPGHWEVRQERTNTAAQLFWINVIARYTNGAYTATEALPPYDGPVLVFQSGQGVINDAG
jgi:predicted acetyltransferase